MIQAGSNIQTANSLSTGETSEAKYRKALAQIQKIHNANRILKAESQSSKAEWEQRTKEMNEAFQSLQRKNSELNEQKQKLKEDNAALAQEVQDLKIGNENLKKIQSNLQRELNDLRQTLSKQQDEIQQLSTLKTDKGLAGLITSYEERELSHSKSLAHQQQIVKTYQTSLKAIESEILKQRRQRCRLQEQNNCLRRQVSQIQQLNAGLISKHQEILLTLANKHSQGREKYRQTEAALTEISKKLQAVTSTRTQQQSNQNFAGTSEAYRQLLKQKQQLDFEHRRLRIQLQKSESRVKDMLEVQERLKSATIKAQHLQEEVNTLKSKLLVVEARQLADGKEQEYKEGQKDEHKETEINKFTIKNSGDSSHFQIMKNYISQTKEKLDKALLEKKEYEKKYQACKQKSRERAEKISALESQNAILLSKIEGFQRLTQRLQQQLERTLQASDEEVTKIKAAASSIISQQAEEAATADAYTRSHHGLQLQMAQRMEKQLRDELAELQSELGAEKAKNGDMLQQVQQVNEFLAIYKAKFEELQTEYQEAQEMHTVLSQNSLRFEQLYREQRTKSEALTAQKYSLSVQLAQLKEQIQKKNQQDSQAQQREASQEAELRRLRAELAQAKNEVSQLHNSLRAASNQVEEQILATSGTARSEGAQRPSLGSNNNQERQRNKQLEAELTAAKFKADQSALQAQRALSLEAALSAKSEELTDTKRKTIFLERQLAAFETEAKSLQNECEALRKQNDALKAKFKAGSNDFKRSSFLKDSGEEKKLAEQLSGVKGELREEKKNNSKLQVELQTAQRQAQRMEQLLEQGRRKETAISQELLSLRTSYDLVCQENSRLKSQLNYKNSMQQRLSTDISSQQKKIEKLVQENSELRLKGQSIDNEYSNLKRELGGLKIYLSQVENITGRSTGGSWQEQRDKEAATNFLLRLKKLLGINSTDHISENRTNQVRQPPVLPTQPNLQKYYQNVYTSLEPRFNNPNYMVSSELEEEPPQFHDYLQ